MKGGEYIINYIEHALGIPEYLNFLSKLILNYVYSEEAHEFTAITKLIRRPIYQIFQEMTPLQYQNVIYNYILTRFDLDSEACFYVEVDNIPEIETKNPIFVRVVTKPFIIVNVNLIKTLLLESHHLALSNQIKNVVVNDIEVVRDDECITPEHIDRLMQAYEEEHIPSKIQGIGFAREQQFTPHLHGGTKRHGIITSASTKFSIIDSTRPKSNLTIINSNQSLSELYKPPTQKSDIFKILSSELNNTEREYSLVSLYTFFLLLENCISISLSVTKTIPRIVFRYNKYTPLKVIGCNG